MTRGHTPDVWCSLYELSLQQSIPYLEASPVVGNLPPMVARGDDRQGLGEVGCALQHKGAFLKGLGHEVELARIELEHGLFQVAHAAMDELGGA